MKSDPLLFILVKLYCRFLDVLCVFIILLIDFCCVFAVFQGRQENYPSEGFLRVSKCNIEAAGNCRGRAEVEWPYSRYCKSKYTVAVAVFVIACFVFGCQTLYLNYWIALDIIIFNHSYIVDGFHCFADHRCSCF